MNNVVPTFKNKLYFFIVILILIGYIVTMFSIEQFKHKRIENLQDTTLTLQTQAYNLTYNQFHNLSNAIFETLINTPKINQIINNTEDTDAQTRAKLLEELNPAYHNLKKFNVDKIHFHTIDNKSFLRFHKPDQYGDDLSSFRNSVVSANLLSKPYEAFEIGAYGHGYRFIYPLKKNKKNISSVEISISTNPFIKTFEKNYGNSVSFLISKHLVDEIVVNKDPSKYINNKLNLFYIFHNHSIDNQLMHIPEEMLKFINQKIQQGKPFLFQQNNNFISLIPVGNSYTDSIDGCFIITKHNAELESINNSFMYLKYFITIVLFLILLTIHKFSKFELKLYNKSQDLKHILDNQQAIIVVSDGNTLLDANKRFFEFFNIASIHTFNLQHKCICDIFEQEDDSINIQPYINGIDWITYILNYPQKIHNVKLKAKNGTVHTFQISISKLTDKYVISFYDITEHLNQKKELYKINILFENVLNSVEEPIYYKDKDLRYLGCNKAFLQQIGKNKSDILEKTDQELFPEEKYIARYNHEMKVLNSLKTNVTFDWLNYDNNEEQKYCMTAIAPLYDEVSSEILGIVSNSVNMTKQKQLESSLCELTQNLEHIVQEEIAKNLEKDSLLQKQGRLAAMGEMISMIAHQWRQPLATISSSAVTLKLKLMLEKYDLLTDHGRDDFIQTLSKELDDIEDMVEVLTTTIDDFRTFYKPNKESRIVTINEPIEKALKIIKGELINNNIKIIEKYNSTKELRLYDNELMQVFLNIIKNSYDNFKELNSQDAVIAIETKDTDIGVSVKILDNGGGIQENIIDKIFDPYFSTKDEKNGTGLGLYMSKMIIEQQHNGSLSVQNRDYGVCFTIVLNSIA